MGTIRAVEMLLLGWRCNCSLSARAYNTNIVRAACGGTTTTKSSINLMHRVTQVVVDGGHAREVELC